MLLRLPLAGIETHVEADTIIITIPAGRVLVVDDEELVLQTCAGMVKMAGYEVVTAGSGEKALEIFTGDDAAFDLVILDVVMPGIGGLEVCRRMLRIDDKIKIILTSGFIRDAEASSELASDRCRFIQKPYNMGQLLHEMKTAVEVRDG